MKRIECGSLMIPQICQILEYVPGAMAQSICYMDDNELLAGFAFDHYNGSTVNVHVLVRKNPPLEYWQAVFDYPFNVLHVRKVIGQISSTHPKVRHLAESIGFVEEARIKDFYGEGDDLVIMTLTKDKCLVLNDPEWYERARTGRR